MKRTLKFLPHAALAACLYSFAPAHAQVCRPARVRVPVPVPMPMPRRGQVEDERRLRVLVEPPLNGDEYHVRGEVLEREGKRKEARAAFAEAVKLHLVAYRRLGVGRRTPMPDWSAEDKAGFRAELADRLKRAAESARRYLLLGDAESELERENLEALAAHAALLSETDERRAAFFTFELTGRAKIHERPEPGYTREARAKRTSGTVIVRGVLSSDGTVKHVLVLKGLPHGLSEKAVEAARGIKFDPATKNGQPVSQFVMLEFNFSVY